MFKVRDAQGKYKYAGRSRAIVIDNRDPLNKGRIQVNHALLGDTVWIDYLRDPGSFDTPSIGSIVYIECDSGMYEHPIAWGLVTKGTDANPQIPTAFKRDIPTNRGFFTPGGHLFEMDDGEATITQNPDDKQFTAKSRGIRVTSSGNNKIHIVEDTVAGSQYILLQDAGGNILKLDYKNNKLTINSIGTTQVDTAQSKAESVGTDDTLNVGGNRTETIGANKTEGITGNKSETVGGNLTIAVTGNVTITCAQASITASGDAEVTAATIKLNGSAGDVLTTVTDPVVDTIFGIPTVGVPTVKAG
jgi:Gp5-like OB domain-containing protein/type VI secretion system (T6SS) baseplate-like injector VgrG